MNQMKQSDKVLTERQRLNQFETRLMMSSEGQNKKSKRESWNKNLEEFMLNKQGLPMINTEPQLKEQLNTMRLWCNTEW